MLVARILYPVEVLGPGKRIGIWMCGCEHACKGCSNPELWKFDSKYEISIDNMFEILKQLNIKNQIDGFTITGGDPFEQLDELEYLVEKLNSINSDILVYTGYTLNELKEKHILSITNILDNIAVLIDGKYIEEQNTNSILRGSNNQEIHILNNIYQKKYKDYICTATNQIQNFRTMDGTVSVGIHMPGFINQLNNDVKKFGLKKESSNGRLIT